MDLRTCLLAICLLSFAQAQASEPNIEDQRMKYQDLLLFKPSDFQTIEKADTILEQWLLPTFNRAVKAARTFDYELEDVPAFFDFKVFAEDDVSPELKAQDRSNRKLSKLISNTIPVLAYAYQTPGNNPYYQNEEVLQLYTRALEYCYSRGLTEHAWTTDHAGRASGRGAGQGLARSGGDFSSMSLQLGGFIQSVFLMRD